MTKPGTDWEYQHQSGQGMPGSTNRRAVLALPVKREPQQVASGWQLESWSNLAKDVNSYPAPAGRPGSRGSGRYRR